MTLIPSLTFTDYEWFPWNICNGCGMPAGNAYPSGYLVPSPILGLANAPIVETKFLELAMSLLDFSPRIPLGTFSILLSMLVKYRCQGFGEEKIGCQQVNLVVRKTTQVSKVLTLWFKVMILTNISFSCPSDNAIPRFTCA